MPVGKSFVNRVKPAGCRAIPLDRVGVSRQNRGMSGATSFRVILRRAGPPALGLIVMAFFGGYAVIGPNGILAYGDYKRQLAARQATFAMLDKQRAALRNRVNLLDPRHADPDMVDYLVRKELNVTHPDEVILPLR